MDNIIRVRLDNNKRLYLRAIIGTRLPYEDAQYQDYMKYFDKGKCVWDEKKLLSLSEDELVKFYDTLDSQIERDNMYNVNGDDRFMDKDGL